MICAKGSNADNRFKIGIKKQKKTARCIKVQNSVGHSTDLHIPAQAFWLWSYVTKLPALLHISFIYSLLRVLSFGKLLIDLASCNHLMVLTNRRYPLFIIPVRSF